MIHQGLTEDPRNLASMLGREAWKNGSGQGAHGGWRIYTRGGGGEMGLRMDEGERNLEGHGGGEESWGETRRDDAGEEGIGRGGGGGGHGRAINAAQGKTIVP